jgi:hypothetical protein
VWEDLAAALHWIIEQRLAHLGITGVVHYVDDFLVIVLPEHAATILEVLRATGEELGVPWEARKTMGPDTRLPFLGINVDTATMTLSLPPTKAAAGLELIERLLRDGRCHIDDLRTIGGTLAHFAKAVRSGRTFTRRLYDSPASFSRRGPAAIPEPVICDFQWWRHALPMCEKRSVPMTASDWARGTFAVIHTDACTHGHGAGATLTTAGPPGPMRWLHHEWSAGDRALAMRSERTSSNFLEAAAVLIALRTWALALSGGKARDNTATISCLREGYCKCPHLMGIVRSIWLLATQHNIVLAFSRIAGAANVHADDLSRGHIDAFRRNNPHAATAADKADAPATFASSC